MTAFILKTHPFRISFCFPYADVNDGTGTAVAAGGVWLVAIKTRNHGGLNVEITTAVATTTITTYNTQKYGTNVKQYGATACILEGREKKAK